MAPQLEITQVKDAGKSRGSTRLAKRQSPLQPSTVEPVAVVNVVALEAPSAERSSGTSTASSSEKTSWGQLGAETVQAGSTHNAMSRGWTELSAAEMTSRTVQLQEMGFSESDARDALTRCGWMLNEALDFLLNPPPSTVESAFGTPSALRTPARKGATSNVDLKSPILPADSAAGSTTASGGSSPRGMPPMWDSPATSPEATTCLVRNSAGDASAREPVPVTAEMKSSYLLLNDPAIVHIYKAAQSAPGTPTMEPVTTETANSAVLGDPAIVHITRSARALPGASAREPLKADMANLAKLDDPAIVYATQGRVPDASTRGVPLMAETAHTAAAPALPQAAATNPAATYPAVIHPIAAYPAVACPAVPYPDVAGPVVPYSDVAYPVVPYQANYAAANPPAFPAVTHPAMGVPEMGISIVPGKRLERVRHTWQAESSCSTVQLSVEEGDFVNVWPNSMTEQGWIYAESLIFSSNAGWIPSSMLQVMPANLCWMRASKSSPAVYETQMAMDAGNVVLVDTAQTTSEWVYAELPKRFGGEDNALTEKGGWVPISFLDWSQS